MKDYLKQYVNLRDSLVKEKASLEARLKQINAALSSESPTPSAPVARKPRGKRAKNKLSLKAAVSEVTKGKALAKNDILTAIKKIGYKFSTSDPMNSLNTVLYTGKQFKNVGGKFTVA
jgi:hypothetical protein